MRLTLCRIPLADAQRLGMAARAAGGWIAVAPVCRAAAEATLSYRSLLALLPADWTEAVHPLTRAEARAIAERLERATRYSDDAATAADFAARIHAQIGGAS